MNSVETVLLHNIDNPNSCFVFPTDIAASRWADHLLRLRMLRPHSNGLGAPEGQSFQGTVAMKKFIAWDTFKQNSIKSKVQNKKSIPSALRKIFVSRLIKENAEACKEGDPGMSEGQSFQGTPVFSSLIRVQWAQQASQFAPWLTRLLPQLAVWFYKTTGLAINALIGKEAAQIAAQKTAVFEGDDRDMLVLAQRYAQFLEAHGLFEPAWETPPFNNDGTEYFIFFPESLSDYGEYRELLEAGSHVKTISAADTENLPCDTFFYTNSRSEITEAALYIRALHENKGVKWDSIAVCIPDPENYEPYVLREFANRNIPFVKRSSKPLANYPAGQFFRSVVDCTSRDFAFSALASLVLNRNLPWKETEQIHNLIEFGIKNNCISSWIEEKDGKEQTVNVWEDAFNQPFGGIAPAALHFFVDLRRRLQALRTAGSFSELRRQYFIFRERFFDMDKCTEETDLILSRCIAELMYLVEIEKDYPDVKAVDPFMFFTEYLNEVNYLAQTQAAGVNILPYKTAAAAPFDCHIILGAGQDNLSVVFSGLDFLPRKKREKLGIFDEDASAAFINMHKFNSVKHAAFFCCEQNFSGFTIPHSKIGAPSEPKIRYATERDGSPSALQEKFSQDYYKAENSLESLSPLKLHENQIDGFEKWKTRRKHTEVQEQADGSVNLKTNKALLELIKKKYAKDPQFPGKYGVSASSMEPYYQCSLKWLYERVLSLENVSIEASLMAENISGMVYHAALNLFFTKLKEKEEPLLKPQNKNNVLSLTEDYSKLLELSMDTIFNSFPLLQTGSLPQAGSLLQAGIPPNDSDKGSENKPQMSALTARLVRAGKKQLQLHLEKCLAEFLSLFAGCRVVGCETSYKAEHKNYYLNGKLDCILETSEKEHIIVDFKRSSLPKKADCTGDGENGLSDFQLPMYITLAEKNEDYKIFTALFYSILKLKPEVIFGTVQDTDKNVKIPKKEEDQIIRESKKYREIVEEFKQKAEQFANEISTGNFSVFETKYNECYKCHFHRICRTVYIINREKMNLFQDQVSIVG